MKLCEVKYSQPDKITLYGTLHVDAMEAGYYDSGHSRSDEWIKQRGVKLTIKLVTDGSGWGNSIARYGSVVKVDAPEGSMAHDVVKVGEECTYMRDSSGWVVSDDKMVWNFDKS